jgi:hypothetical protein
LNSHDQFNFGGGSNPTGTPAAGDCGSTIYVVSAGGNGETNLTNNPGEDYDPVWSPAP